MMTLNMILKATAVGAGLIVLVLIQIAITAFIYVSLPLDWIRRLDYSLKAAVIILVALGASLLIGGTILGYW